MENDISSLVKHKIFTLLLYSHVFFYIAEYHINMAYSTYMYTNQGGGKNVYVYTITKSYY